MTDGNILTKYFLNKSFYLFSNCNKDEQASVIRTYK